MKAKEGYKTTEFWMVVLGMVGTAYGVPVDPEILVAGGSFVTGIYIWARTMAKRKG